MFAMDALAREIFAIRLSSGKLKIVEVLMENGIRKWNIKQSCSFIISASVFTAIEKFE